MKSQYPESFANSPPHTNDDFSVPVCLMPCLSLLALPNEYLQPKVQSMVQAQALRLLESELALIKATQYRAAYSEPGLERTS